MIQKSIMLFVCFIYLLSYTVIALSTQKAPLQKVIVIVLLARFQPHKAVCSCGAQGALALRVFCNEFWKIRGERNATEFHVGSLPVSIFVLERSKKAHRDPKNRFARSRTPCAFVCDSPFVGCRFVALNRFDFVCPRSDLRDAPMDTGMISPNGLLLLLSVYHKRKDLSRSF